MKIALTVGAVYLVTRKIDLGETLSVLSSMHIGWLLLAVFFFNLSKIVSAYRLLVFLKIPAIHVSGKSGLKLCYAGMFYNLFLPGGIGGDGYKVYLLKSAFRERSLKKIVSAAFLDRLSGMAALVFLAVMLFPFTHAGHFLNDFWVKISYVIAIVAFYPLLFVANGFFFKSFRPVFRTTSLQSFGVQFLQLVCAFFLLISLGVEVAYLDYMELFLLSSVVAVLPFTIGGVGARELVFIYGYEFLPIDKHVAVAFSLAFFLISVISSLPGAFLKTGEELKQKTIVTQ